MKFLKPLTVIATAIPLALTGCVTDPVTGQQSASKTAMYGLGGAAVCGIVGALTHGGKGARNSALACGAVGAGIGGYMDYQEKNCVKAWPTPISKSNAKATKSSWLCLKM